MSTEAPYPDLDHPGYMRHCAGLLCPAEFHVIRGPADGWRIGRFHPSAGPADCPFGHFLSPGSYTRSWMPCICPPALETGLGGHRVWQCGPCHDEMRQTACYVPPHCPAPGARPLTAS